MTEEFDSIDKTGHKNATDNTPHLMGEGD